jgi:hypothetical protein
MKLTILVEMAPKWPINPDIMDFDMAMGTFCREKIW